MFEKANIKVPVARIRAARPGDTVVSVLAWGSKRAVQYGPEPHLTDVDPTANRKKAAWQGQDNGPDLPPAA